MYNTSYAVTMDRQQTTQLHLSLDDVRQAHKRVCDWVHFTPVLTSSQFDQSHGRKFYFKAENFQKTGSFKVRGALNAVSYFILYKYKLHVVIYSYVSLYYLLCYSVVKQVVLTNVNPLLEPTITKQ